MNENQHIPLCSLQSSEVSSQGCPLIVTFSRTAVSKFCKRWESFRSHPSGTATTQVHLEKPLLPHETDYLGENWADTTGRLSFVPGPWQKRAQAPRDESRQHRASPLPASASPIARLPRRRTRPAAPGPGPARTGRRAPSPRPGRAGSSTALAGPARRRRPGWAAAAPRPPPAEAAAATTATLGRQPFPASDAGKMPARKQNPPPSRLFPSDPGAAWRQRWWGRWTVTATSRRPASRR